MKAVILSCAYLKRDVTALKEMVPWADVYLGPKTQKAEDGCLQNHQHVVAEAKRAGFSRLFVMEDDCQFTRYFDFQRWQADADWAQANGYDLLVGGSTRTYHERRVREGLIEVKAFHSAHCLVYFKSSYDKVARTVQPFDLSLGCEVTSNFKTRYAGCRVVLAFPFVAVQRPVYSGILKRRVNYVPEYATLEARLAAIA